MPKRDSTNDLQPEATSSQAPSSSPALEGMLYGDCRLPKYSSSTLLLNSPTLEYAPNFFHESLAFNFHCNKGIALLQERQSHRLVDVFHYDITTLLNDPIIIVQLENFDCAGRLSCILEWNKVTHPDQAARKIHREPARLYEEGIQYLFAFSFALVDDGRRQPIILPFIGKVWVFRFW